jgi:hypothetical protein
MNITCFIINIANRQKSLLSSVKKAMNLEITGVVESMDMFLFKLLPLDFNPDIVIIDFKSFKSTQAHLHFLHNKCRCLVITDAGKANTSNFDHRFEFTEGNSYNYLQIFAKSVGEDKKRDKEFGWHSCKVGRLIFETRHDECEDLDWNAIFQIKCTQTFSYVSIVDRTYVSPYQITQLSVFNKVHWIAKASKKRS